jgi:hypothetical protein
MLFEMLHESAAVPLVPASAGAATSTTVQVFLRVDEQGSTSTVFVGDGEGPQLHPAAARSLAAALHEAADVAERGRAS